MDSHQLKRRRSGAANPYSSFPPSSKKARTSLANPFNFDPSSSQGPSQPHLPSDTQALGSASQGSMWAFAHPSEPSSPSFVTGGSTDTHVDRATCEQRGHFQAAPTYEVCNLCRLSLSTTPRKLAAQTQRSVGRSTFGSADFISPTPFGMDTVTRVGTGDVDLETGANIALAETQNFPDTYLKPFKDFNQAVTTLAKIHPFARMALGILIAISQMFVAQQTRDGRVSRLLDTIRKVYEFLTEETTLKAMSGMREPLAKIALMTSGAVQFIKNNSVTEDFWKRSGKDVEYEARDVSIAYIEMLDDLMQQYRRLEDRGIQVDAFCIPGNPVLSPIGF